MIGGHEASLIGKPFFWSPKKQAGNGLDELVSDLNFSLFTKDKRLFPEDVKLVPIIARGQRSTFGIDDGQ